MQEENSIVLGENENNSGKPMKTLSPEKIDQLLIHAKQIVDQWDNYDRYRVCAGEDSDEPYGVSITRFMIESYEEIKK